jgi:hypothetical protein
MNPPEDGSGGIFAAIIGFLGGIIDYIEARAGAFTFLATTFFGVCSLVGRKEGGNGRKEGRKGG